MNEQRTVTDITDIPGIFAAHTTRAEGGSGCTVIVCPKGATGGVDVRGGSPATRETDLLRPEETVDVLHAVVLSGGSAYGLAAACGVAEELERHHIGIDVGCGVVPIVSSACLFDLPVGDTHTRPTARDGADACKRALTEHAGPLEQGNVGAGTGCSVGKIAGRERTMKSGLGQAVLTSHDLICGAVSAVNALGNVLDPETQLPIAGTLDETHTHIVDTEELVISANESSMFSSVPDRTNTTISCVVTNARLTKAQATKVAQMCADAYAHAIRPTHTTSDGDTIFVMATGDVPAAPDAVGMLATRALEQAIANGARHAQSAYGLIAACDL
ncbi:MAG: P1 family peptidase [Atopobiaceae bacterium]|jgi:L-aminopeptidase/D-esterase-like protein